MEFKFVILSVTPFQRPSTEPELPFCPNYQLLTSGLTTTYMRCVYGVLCHIHLIFHSHLSLYWYPIIVLYSTQCGKDIFANIVQTNAYCHCTSWFIVQTGCIRILRYYQQFILCCLQYPVNRTKQVSYIYLTYFEFTDSHLPLFSNLWIIYIFHTNHIESSSRQTWLYVSIQVCDD